MMLRDYVKNEDFGKLSHICTYKIAYMALSYGRKFGTAVATFWVVAFQCQVIWGSAGAPLNNKLIIYCAASAVI